MTDLLFRLARLDHDLETLRLAAVNDDILSQVEALQRQLRQLIDEVRL